ncbi:hypothetical protein FKO01_21815 [Mesorhizobium sp. B2-3-3]|nr:hypothetical protein FKO01_21815 [Mesorhizobium sp. B2-3-3]
MFEQDRKAGVKTIESWSRKFLGRNLVRTLAVIVPSLGAIGGGAVYVYDFFSSYHAKNLERHTANLKEYLSTTVQGTYLESGNAPMYWRADQVYDHGDTPCKGAISYHEELRLQLDNEDVADTRRARKFDFINTAEVNVLSGIYPDFVFLHLQPVS